MERVIDGPTLRRLRAAVSRLRDGVRHADVVALVEAAVPGVVTVDLDGDPVVVVQLAEERRSLDGLSDRETEVAGLVALGLANKEIAERLGIAVGTVKDHVHAILRKTGLPNRTAVAAALNEPAKKKPRPPPSR